jgi:hypothetical protein
MQRRAWAIGTRPGLDEHVLPLRFVSGGGKVTLLLLVIGIAVAAATQLELGPDLVERPAEVRGDRATWHSDR